MTEGHAPPLRDGAASSDGPRTGRRVEFTPDTRRDLNRDSTSTPRRGVGRMQRQPPPQPWTPYIVGFCMLCVGPMRPLLYELFSLLYAQFEELVYGSPEEQETPWYDQ